MLETRAEPDALGRVIIPALTRAERVLVAIDAPLGWPAALPLALANHSAGEAVRAEKSELFSRETDRFVRRAVGKKPLEVAADKIARATHTALEILARMRAESGRPIPLAWTPSFGGAAAIEVYPAGTLKARGLPSSGYKTQKEKEKGVRREIARALRNEIPDLRQHIDATSDQFDACLCLLAARDFLEAETFQPEDEERARREGWIWVRKPAC